MKVSILDGIDGLGQARAKALLKHFGSMKALKGASIEELEQVVGVGPSLAARIHQGLHASGEKK
jgi:excinuclease ABC subunit C